MWRDGIGLPLERELGERIGVTERSRQGSAIGARNMNCEIDRARVVSWFPGNSMPDYLASIGDPIDEWREPVRKTKRMAV
jgi:hypothetical protein